MLALAALPRHRVSGIPDGPRPPVAVLVPAHNEEHVIGRSLASIAGQLAAGDRLVVIADKIAPTAPWTSRAAHGAEIITRTDPVRRGKGYAASIKG